MVDVMLRRARRRERAAREQMASAAQSTPGWAGRCARARTCRARRPAPAAAGGRARVTGSAVPRPAPIPSPRPGSCRRPRIPPMAGRWWSATPESNVILVTGRVFDVLDVPADAGLQALGQMERAGTTPGPVAVSTGERALFFVATRGAAAAADEWWSLPSGLRPRRHDRDGGPALALPRQLRARAAVQVRHRRGRPLDPRARRAAAAGRGAAAGVSRRRIRGGGAMTGGRSFRAADAPGHRDPAGRRELPGARVRRCRRHAAVHRVRFRRHT